MEFRRCRIMLQAFAAFVLGAAVVAPAMAQTGSLKVASTLREIFDNLPLYVALEGGLYKKHGINVEVTHFKGGGDVVRAVSGGAGDIGMVGTSAAIVAASRGAPLKTIVSRTDPAYAAPMKKTVDIEPELYAAAERLAQSQQKSLGEVVSELLRRTLGLDAEPEVAAATELERRNGFDVFPERTGPKATVEGVQQLCREEGI